jgi:hypothetical protein
VGRERLMMDQGTIQPSRPGKRRGRPYLPPGEGKTARVEWRTTPERKARAQRLADRAGVPLSKWLDRQVDLVDD